VFSDELLSSDPSLQDYLRQLKASLQVIEISQAVPAPAGAKFVSGISVDYPFIQEVLAQLELPEELAAVVAIESAGNPAALSPKGARGLWQLMPDTARRFGLRVDRQTDERLDPVKSTYAAARYLSELYGIFHDWPLALAAYNAGENRVRRVIDSTGIQRFSEMANRKLLPAETIHYVPAVLNLMQAGSP
jgi:membrane-bound lytic murein transglycosylase D